MGKSSEIRNYLLESEQKILNDITSDIINKSIDSPDAKALKIQYFEMLLRGTNRDGVEEILSFLKETDFYNAPSSTKYHCNYDGGLLDHSLLVCKTAIDLRNTLCESRQGLRDLIPIDSIIICTLLHDICKTGYYKKTQKWKKNESNQWVSYDGYEVVDNFPIGHGEKSVIMLQKFGLDLNAEEMIAIRWHMGAYSGAQYVYEEKAAYDRAVNISPLTVILQLADNSSSLLLEKMVEN